MKSISISGTKRADLGKKATKEVRKQGLVPCVIYGEKKDANGAPEAVHFVVDEKQINKLVYTPDIYAVNLEVDGEKHLAILKEIQFHPVKDNVLHVDFYEVTPTKPIVMAVPIAARVILTVTTTTSFGVTSSRPSKESSPHLMDLPRPR